MSPIPFIYIILFIHISFIIFSNNAFGPKQTTKLPRKLTIYSSSTGKDLSNGKSTIIIGVNKYSHDTAVCFVDSKSGEVILTQAKERITGIKHDGGDINSLIMKGLKSINCKLDDVAMVVSNNHHFRVLPYERRLKFTSGIHYNPRSYLKDTNILPHIPQENKLEISHHLAHAWSGLSTAPFKKGLICVMDGMGESYSAMMEDMLRVDPDTNDDYMHDLKLLKAYGADNFIGQPVSLYPGSNYREAETAYVFDAESSQLKPVFKRWSRERSPSELYNHGFENMESIGAVYSRISSHILGDWNACGKIMGLSSWANRKNQEAKEWLGKDSQIGRKFNHAHSFMSGNPVSGSFKINWQEIESLDHVNQFSEENFDYFANVANSVQNDLNSVTMEMLQSLKDLTGETNLILVGGVALNSVMNGKIKESRLFNGLYIPPAPGDEGIALGAAMYGLQRYREREEFKKSQAEKIFSFPRSRVDALLSMDPNSESFGTPSTDNRSNPSNTPPVVEEVHLDNSHTHDHSHGHSHGHDHHHDHDNQPVVPFQQLPAFSPYQGFHNSDADVDAALYDMEPWIDIVRFNTVEEMLESAASDLSGGKVIAWYQGRSELGQRALGSRSILASPANKETRRFINEKVKMREWFRPLAPSVLVEHVGDWFEGLSNDEDASPFMSLTAQIKANKIDRVPAVSHIDGSARLQTVSQAQNSLYHRLINMFYKLTGVPMVLNTSFNGKNQPIVETPSDAIRALLAANGAIDELYLGLNKIKVKPFPSSIGGSSEAHMGEELLLEAQTIYLSEVTSSVSENDDFVPVRVRIQVGSESGEDSDDIESTENESWIELPSRLHLDILQLLQPRQFAPVETDEEDIDSSENTVTSAVSVGELYAGLFSIYCNEEGEFLDPNYSWGWEDIVDALRWLYERQLISVSDPNEELSPEEIFSGAEVVDLRSITN